MENPPFLEHFPRETPQIADFYTQMKWDCRHLETTREQLNTTNASSEMREGQVLQSCPARRGALPRRPNGYPHTLAS